VEDACDALAFVPGGIRDYTEQTTQARTCRTALERNIMAILSGLAVYFVIWWLVLFAVLPIGLRTQDEDQNVVPGTVASAPTRFRAARIFLVTTVVSGLIYAAWYIAGAYFDIGFNNLPIIVPGLEPRA
jgi:predicted secreted protein